MTRKFLILLANTLNHLLKATRGKTNWVPREPYFTFLLTMLLVIMILTCIVLPCLAPILLLPIILIALFLYLKWKFLK